jgi:predicted MPP superfamily phosphohydrolase
MRPGVVACTCAAPGSRPGHLYDLDVRLDGTGAQMPHAVAVRPENAEHLTLLHCTDLHLLQPASGAMQDRSALIAALVTRINALRPDLVVCTGDLITRYDAQQRALPAEQIRWQIRRIKELLSQIESPLYVTLGNHDAAFAATRRDWYAAMGGGWNGHTDDFSMDWGPYHLAMLDCFAHYDPQNVLIHNSFTAEQLEWLRRDLLAASESRLRLVFAHYDYRAQLPELFRELRIDLLFYGHAKGLYPETLAEHGIWDGHLADTEAYRLVRLAPSGILSEKASWASLAVRTCAPVPGHTDR